MLFRTKVAVLALAISAAQGQPIELKSASTSPMRYYLSLPQSWSAGKQWPLIVVIESARRDFKLTADEFSKARGTMPFILAVPMVITGGGSGYRQVSSFRYSEAEWAQIEKAGGCQFDEDGIAAVVKDLRTNYGAEAKYFLASWEAGGHTAFATVFHHPELLRAAAFADPNYQGRCVAFSTDASRAKLPVKVFLSGVDVDVPPTRFVHQQSARAKEEAEQHGFRGVLVEVLPSTPHGPMPDALLTWFQSLRPE